ncbi:hypothetical protein FFF34_013695 [Inquilinus sp. KBS0705]|nr:hypothetical protein FFF34_013695 [Inquilinus sp. KBS0705]
MMMQDAVTRRFEIIGEAASKVSDTIKQNYPQVPPLVRACRAFAKELSGNSLIMALTC